MDIAAPRGFERAEFEARTHAAQAAMAAEGLGALLLTTEPEVRYFTGYLTRFWESPSRSWFLVLPARGAPIAVIPSIGAALMAQTWISDIRTWPAPRPKDDGVSLLAETLREVGGPVGVPMGYEAHLRMPLGDYVRVQAASGLEFRGDAGIVAALRAIKSEAEIDKIRAACAIATRAYARMGEIAGEGVPLSTVFRGFQRLLLEEGADWVPYISGAAAQGGYDDVISPASDMPLALGDVMMLDTGAVRDGYFCDFDRNFAIGAPSAEVQVAHARLIEATEVGLAAARPGARACDVFAAMAQIAGGGETAGRLGHGLGMQLTEGLSLTAQDESVLQPGMVITLEPGTEVSPGQNLGKIMVHEENIVIREGGAERLTQFSGPEIVVL
nr:Xaa-Pro peptidase family protein [Roseovarius carneus]